MKIVYVKSELQCTKVIGECIVTDTKAYLLETGELAEEPSGENAMLGT